MKRSALGLAALVAVALWTAAALAKQNLVDPGGSGPGGNLRLCWCEVDPEGRVGPALGADGSEVRVSMRNGQGRLFLKRPCDRIADAGFRSPP